MPEIAVRILLEKNKHLLFVRKIKNGEVTYGLPGGKVEKGETALEALIREIKEEADIILPKKKLHLVHLISRKKKKKVCFKLFFHSPDWKGHINNNEPQNHVNFLWAPIRQIPQQTLPSSKQAIQQFLAGDYYSEIR